VRFYAVSLDFFFPPSLSFFSILCVLASPYFFFFLTFLSFPLRRSSCSIFGASHFSPCLLRFDLSPVCLLPLVFRIRSPCPQPESLGPNFFRGAGPVRFFFPLAGTRGGFFLLRGLSLARLPACDRGVFCFLSFGWVAGPSLFLTNEGFMAFRCVDSWFDWLRYYVSTFWVIAKFWRFTGTQWRSFFFLPRFDVLCVPLRPLFHGAPGKTHPFGTFAMGFFTDKAFV